MSKKRSSERQRHNPNLPPRSELRSGGGNVDPSGSAPEGAKRGAGGQDELTQPVVAGTGNVRKRTGGFKALLAALAVIAVGVGIYLAAGPSGDQMSEQEAQDRSSEYQAFLAGSPMPVKLVGVDEMDRAFDSMPDSVSTEQKQELQTQIDSGQVKLAWLSLWDTHAEDGDILRFESVGSFPIDVMALNKKTTIAIPFPADGNVIVTGVRDGGGGITIALESGATQIQWPTMKVNDQLDLPVTPGF